MQATKTRSSSSEVPPKVSLRAPRQFRPSTLDTDSVSSLYQANRISKDRSPKVVERRSPRSPVPERKRPSRISELESQISQLKEDLKVVRNQLSLSESNKKQAQQEAEESKEKLFSLSLKLEDSQQQLLKLSATEEARVSELQKTIEEHDRAWQSKLEAIEKNLSDDSFALTSAISEIQQLKVQLELVANCENAHKQIAESSNIELLNLKDNLAESVSIMESMKNQIKDCKDPPEAQALVNETLRQLEAAKRTVEFLRADAAKAVHGYDSSALELDQSRTRVNSIEALVNKLESGLIKEKSNQGRVQDDGSATESNHSRNLENNCNLEQEIERLENGEDTNHIKAEIYSLRSEVGLLRSTLETAESKYQEEQIQSSAKIRSAYELIKQIKSESSKRESELEAELERKKADIEELKSNLMDKETELQGIVEENEKLNLKLEFEIRKEVKRLDECVAELKGTLMDKETTLQSISDENEMLKLEISKSLASESEAVAKLGIVMEEVDRSNRKAARATEQLEVAQAAISEIEAELRRVKIQSDQWRKAAEAAAAMLSNNGKLTERSLSLDNNYSNTLMNKYTPFCEEIDDDDFHRKKNGNMLKKIGVLWKKPQK